MPSSNRKHVRRRRSIPTANNQNLTLNPSTSTEEYVLRDDNNSIINDTLPLYFPSTQIAFKLLLCTGFTSAVWLHITDCDETYNYWEPSHYLVFGKGFQTWEYAPQYALRSYTYILLHSVPAWLYYYTLQPSRLLLFYFIRCVLAVIFTICSVYFYKSACREFGVNVGRMVIVFMIFSPGIFISSTAYLPSSFSMYMTMLSTGAWFQRRYELAILSTAFSSLICWPFVAVIGLPIALDVIFRLKKPSVFILWSSIACVTFLHVGEDGHKQTQHSNENKLVSICCFCLMTVIFLNYLLPIIVCNLVPIPQIEIDSSFYGKLVVAPWNILKYNIFTSHGPNLYGIEPWYFYFLNGFLNFNFVFILALCTPLLLLCVRNFVTKKVRHRECLPYKLSLMPFYLWFLIFCLQPHKEERFMFPVYPLVCLCAAVSIDAMQMLWFRFYIYDGYHYLRNTARHAGVFLTIFAILGLSRILALYKAYHAPMDIYIELVKFDPIIKGDQINLCLGKEWHRYSSSFFLPSERWNVHFVKSEFNGLLPGKYIDGESSTMVIREDMNDQNKEENSHYVNINICNLLIDLDTGKFTDFEPDYSHHSNWTVIYSVPYLDAERTQRLIRIFYIPFVWEKYGHFIPYNLLINNKVYMNRNSTKF